RVSGDEPLTGLHLGLDAVVAQFLRYAIRVLQQTASVDFLLALEREPDARREDGDQHRRIWAGTHGAIVDQFVDFAVFELTRARPGIDLAIAGEGHIQA